MLVWLDGRDSKKGNPNENYGRELMELFSLGIGNYTEKDVREAARSFTGWEIQGDEAVFNAGPARRRREDRPRPDGQLGRRRHRAHLPGAEVGARLHHAQAVQIPHQRGRGAAGRADRPAGGAVPQERLRLRRPGEDGAVVEPVLLGAGVSQTDQAAGRFRAWGSSAAWKGTSARAPWSRCWSSWARTCSTRRRSRAGTAARRGSTARRCCSARTWPWP